MKLNRQNCFGSAIAICALPMVFAACGKGANTDPVANMKEAGKDRALQESIYKGECSLKPLQALVTGIRTGGDTAIKSAREQYQFVGANVTHVTNLYTTPDCSGAESLVFKEEGSFVIDESKTTADGGKYLDLTMKALTVDVNNADGLKIAQDSKLCGIQDWTLNANRDVTAAAERLTCYSQPLPSSDATAYKLDGKTLVFGAKAIRNDVRPTHLDLETKYVAE